MEQYSPEFRDEAVKLVLEENQTMAQVSRDLKISLQTLSTWVSRAKKGLLEGTASHNPDLAKLEAENILRENSTFISFYFSGGLPTKVYL